MTSTAWTGVEACMSSIAWLGEHGTYQSSLVESPCPRGRDRWPPFVSSHAIWRCRSEEPKRVAGFGTAAQDEWVVFWWEYPWFGADVGTGTGVVAGVMAKEGVGVDGASKKFCR
ncbi:hypothetical protein L1987_19116 [Smallanthus sonchifolius]|uniref:Uncharacterized protein n=1 Tax=Smallanthus sonchifolius TaxID=185202 RepID=A0ACB9J354_9ASTR|nr:hypothetical protein L1987_19116 [Smallanthus sonchifolius]